MNLLNSFLIVSYLLHRQKHKHFTPLSAIVMERGHYALGFAMPLKPHRIKILE